MGKRIGMVFAILGAAFPGAGIYFMETTNRFGREAARADGTVVAIETSRDAEGDAMYYPVVEFISGGDQLIRFRADTGTGWHPYSVGDTVGVLYSPEDPDAARIDARIQL